MDLISPFPMPCSTNASNIASCALNVIHSMEEGRKHIVERYDGRLNEQDAKIQQLLSMLCMTLRAQDAILEALVEQGIGNGEIKSMHKELKGFILDQVQ